MINNHFYQPHFAMYLQTKKENLLLLLFFLIGFALLFVHPTAAFVFLIAVNIGGFLYRRRQLQQGE